MHSTDYLLIVIAVMAGIWLFQIKRRPRRIGRNETTPDGAPRRTMLASHIPEVEQDANLNLFKLFQSPMQVTPTSLFQPLYDGQVVSSFDPLFKSAVWAQQRRMLQRLEMELEMPLQAELSPHFVVASSTNQTTDFLHNAAADAEKIYATLIDALGVKEPVRLWLGRAAVMLLSNRRHFDHVAWLTGTPLSVSSEGAFFLGESGVIFIALYIALTTDSRRMLVQQVVRAFLHCHGEVVAAYPRWLEEGLVRWIENDLGDWVQGRIGWIEDGLSPSQQVQSIRITDPEAMTTAAKTQAKSPKLATEKAAAGESMQLLRRKAWERVEGDAHAIEAMRDSAFQLVDWLMGHYRKGMLDFLSHYKTSETEDDAWTSAVGMNARTIVQTWQAEETARQRPATEPMFPEGYVPLPQPNEGEYR